MLTKVSLLEIHILIQVACTVLIFCFWWHKPLDVYEPIRLCLRNKGIDKKEIQPIQDIAASFQNPSENLMVNNGTPANSQPSTTSQSENFETRTNHGNSIDNTTFIDTRGVRTAPHPPRPLATTPVVRGAPRPVRHPHSTSTPRSKNASRLSIPRSLAHY